MNRYFLGRGANYSGEEITRHTFAFGTKQDSKNLRDHLAKRYNVNLENVALFCTGRSALAAAIKTIVPKNSEVLATSLTCYAVVEAIKAAGCDPVYADVDSKTLHYSKKELEKALEKHPKVKAVIVQNNLGIPADIEGIEKVCKNHNILLIEDLAHSAGIKYKDGREAGTVGDAAILSFGKGKSIDTIAGGALVLRKEIKGKLRQPKNAPRLADSLRARFYPLFGGIMRGLAGAGLMKYFTSALLKLGFIQRSADARLSVSTRCTHWQAKLALDQLVNLPENRPPIRKFFLVKNREEVLKKLEEAGYYFDDIWYTSPVAPERYYHLAGFREKECPVAMKLSKEIINFPTYYKESELKPARKIIEEYLEDAA